MSYMRPHFSYREVGFCLLGGTSFNCVKIEGTTSILMTENQCFQLIRRDLVDLLNKDTTDFGILLTICYVSKIKCIHPFFE